MSDAVRVSYGSNDQWEVTVTLRKAGCCLKTLQYQHPQSDSNTVFHYPQG